MKQFVLALLLAVATAVQATPIDRWVDAMNAGAADKYTIPGVALPIQVVKQVVDDSENNYAAEWISLPDGVTSGWTHGWVAIEVEDEKVRFFAWTREGPPRWKSQYGQAADVLTTAAALAQGYSELNPIPVPILTTVKLLVVPVFSKSSISNCFNSIPPFEILGWGAAGWNLAVLLGASSPMGAFAATTAMFMAAPSISETFWTCVPSELYRDAKL